MLMTRTLKFNPILVADLDKIGPSFARFTTSGKTQGLCPVRCYQNQSRFLKTDFRDNLFIIGAVGVKS
jgi:hypothetical protein